VSTPAPTDPALLPAHQALPLSALERAQLPPVVWTEATAAFVAGVKPRPYWNGKSPEAIWTVAGSGEKTHEVYRLSFFPRVSEKERAEAEAIMDSSGSGTVEWHLAFGKYGVVELGYVFSPELARELVSLARYQESGFDADQALLEAGFKEDKELGAHVSRAGRVARYFVKKIGRNELTLRVDAYGCKLEYHRERSHHWLNLYQIDVVKAAFNGKVYPLVWPGVVANPSAAALAGALRAAAVFEEQRVGSH